MSQYTRVTINMKKGSTKIDTHQPSDVRPNSDEVIPSAASPDKIAARADLPTKQGIHRNPDHDPTVSIQCLPSDLTEQELIKNLEQRPEQCEQDIMDEFQLWEKQWEEIIAVVQESKQWNDQMDADHRDNIRDKW